MNLVVTGTSSGIGKALAARLLGDGHSVWGLARGPQDELRSHFPDRFTALRCDVAHWADVSAAAEEVTRASPTLDGLVCCAGVQGEIGPACETDPLNWSATIRVNLDGTYFAVRAFAATLLRSRRAKIVCLSGGGATKSRANFSAYGAAKTGVVRLVETIAEECRDQPLDINAVAPGAINTRMTEEVIRLGPEVVGLAEFAAAQKQLSSGGASMGKALGLMLYLLSPESDGISGRLLSAPWDPWATLHRHRPAIADSDIYTLRRIVPEERGRKFD